MKIVKPYESIKNQKITAEQHTDFVGGRLKDVSHAAKTKVSEWGSVECHSLESALPTPLQDAHTGHFLSHQCYGTLIPVQYWASATFPF